MPPERAFHEAFCTERESMIRQFHEAQRDARRLRTVCLDQGLGPEGDMPFELQDEAFDQSVGVRGILDRSTGSSNEALLAPSGPLRFRSLDSTNVHKRIETWLTDLDEDAGPPSRTDLKAHHQTCSLVCLRYLLVLLQYSVPYPIHWQCHVISEPRPEDVRSLPVAARQCWTPCGPDQECMHPI